MFYPPWIFPSEPIHWYNGDELNTTPFLYQGAEGLSLVLLQVCPRCYTTYDKHVHRLKNLSDPHTTCLLNSAAQPSSAPVSAPARIASASNICFLTCHNTCQLTCHKFVRRNYYQDTNFRIGVYSSLRWVERRRSLPRLLVIRILPQPPTYIPLKMSPRSPTVNIHVNWHIYCLTCHNTCQLTCHTIVSRKYYQDTIFRIGFTGSWHALAT